MQSLRKLLPDGCTYLPADLRAWTPEVEICDLNAGRLPEAHLGRCNTVTLLGVIEYINNLPLLFTALASRAERLIVSYNCVDFEEVDRTGFGWVNNYTSDQIVSMLQEAGYVKLSAERFGRMEILIHLVNPNFGILRRCRRSLLRFWRAQTAFNNDTTTEIV